MYEILIYCTKTQAFPKSTTSFSGRKKGGLYIVTATFPIF